MKTLLVVGIIACVCAMHATALPRPAAEPDIYDSEDKMDAESLVTSETRFGRRRWGGHGGGFGGGFGGGHGGGLGGGFGGGLGGGFGGGGGLGGGFGGGGGGGFGGGFGGGWGR